MFIENKYTKWYYQLIDRARCRVMDGYIEKHHIIPKSLGGNNSKDNLAILTAREHFICHWLLTKMTTGQFRAKMIYGLCCIIQQRNLYQQDRLKITSKKYEQIRILISENLRNRIFTDEYRQKLKDSAPRLPRSEEVKRKISETKKGVPRSEETKDKMRNRVCSEETRLKMSLAKKGRPTWNKGLKIK